MKWRYAWTRVRLPSSPPQKIPFRLVPERDFSLIETDKRPRCIRPSFIAYAPPFFRSCVPQYDWALPGSALQQADGPPQVIYAHQLQALKPLRVQMAQPHLRHNGTGEADALGFPQALFQIGHVAHLAAQAHLADGHGLIAQGPVQQRGHQRQTHRQIAGGFVQLQAAHDVHVDVQAAKEKAGSLFQHRQKQIHPVVVKPAGRPPGGAQAAFGRQRLHFAEDGAGALHGTGHAVTADSHRAAFQQQFGGIDDLGQALPRHIKHADFVGGTIAVLCCAQNPIGQRLVPFKIQHRVHNVFHYLRAGNRAVFIHVTHNEGGDLQTFCHIQQAGGTLLHLRDAAGRSGQIRGVHGLDGVDHHQIGLVPLDQAADLVNIIFGGQQNALLRNAQPVGAQLYLPHRFLTRNIQHLKPAGDRPAQLQQQGGFARARFAAQQHHASHHHAAAQHPVQLADAGDDPAFRLCCADAGQRLRANAADPGRAAGGCRPGRGRLRFRRHNILHHGIPRPAGRAFSHPAWAGIAALRANIHRF